MTSSTSNPSLRELSVDERAAWKAHNAWDEQVRDARFGRLTFLEKLRELECRGRELGALQDRAQRRRQALEANAAEAAPR